MVDNLNYFISGNFIVRALPKNSFLKNTYSKLVLNFLQSILVKIVLFFHNSFFRRDKSFKHTISLCGIFKNEARFLDEWIRYHLVIGVDHFYLYNNNSDDNYAEILKPYINEGIVELLDWPFENSQMKAYEHCYSIHRYDTNWLTFIDVDEFICPIASDNIKIWLKSYSKYPGVAVYWKQFGSNGKLIHDTNKYVIEQYTQCWAKYSTLTKMFCNMHFPIIDFPNMHILNSKVGFITIPPINQFKKLISFGINRVSIFKNSNIQINHYWGKAYDIFMEKIQRSDAHYENDNRRREIRKSLLKSHEAMCTERDFTIHRFLLNTKLKEIN